MLLSQMIFIFYGTKKFDKNKFKPVRNSIFPDKKPAGSTGLWASPINSKYGWKDWCKDEEFRECDKKNSFKFTLSEDANVYTINNYEDLEKLPITKHNGSEYWHGLDFEKIAVKYDAILLTERGQWNTRLSQPLSLYGWDCECILILKADKIIPLN